MLVDCWIKIFFEESRWDYGKWGNKKWTNTWRKSRKNDKRTENWQKSKKRKKKENKEVEFSKHY